MLSTTRRGVSYPTQVGRPDAPDIPLHMQNMALAIDADAIWQQGTAAARPASATPGTFYWATDTSVLSVFVTAWTTIAALASPAFTGTPTAPTQASTDNSTAIATTAFVRTMVPPGVVQPYVGLTAPTGWLLCDGASYPTASFPALFALIGYTFGGSGANFNVPDLRGRVPVGKAASGTFATLGSIGGVETYALAIGDLPSHTHTGTTNAETTDHTHSGTTGGESVSHTHSGTTGGRTAAHTHSSAETRNTVNGQSYGAGSFPYATSILTSVTSTESSDHAHSFTTGIDSQDHTHNFTTGGRSSAHTHQFTTAATGSNTPHTNLQPYLVMPYIIKT